jgi:hypothetical protein
MEHIRHHEANRTLIVGLLILLALVIERLYRLRYLHCGGHGIRCAMDLFTYLSLSLGTRCPAGYRVIPARCGRLAALRRCLTTRPLSVE